MVPSAGEEKRKGKERGERLCSLHLQLQVQPHDDFFLCDRADKQHFSCLAGQPHVSLATYRRYLYFSNLIYALFTGAFIAFITMCL